MTPVYLYYEVESAFVQMDHALENAQKHATPEGKLLYGRLMDELIGIRDRARQELLDLHTKKAAPAVSATETAKGDSCNESTFSLDENPEDVKPRAHLRISILDDKHTEIDVHANTMDDAWALLSLTYNLQDDLITMIRANMALSGGAEK